jgi:hypothetical protein
MKDIKKEKKKGVLVIGTFMDSCLSLGPSWTVACDVGVFVVFYCAAVTPKQYSLRGWF